MYYFTSREKRKTIQGNSKDIKEKKHNVIFLIVPTKKEVALLIKDLSILLQDYDLIIDKTKGRFRIRGSEKVEAQKFVILQNTPQKTKGLPEESTIYVGGII